MPPVAALQSQHMDLRTETDIAFVARVLVIRNFEDAEPIWRELERNCDRLHSAFQRFDLLQAWYSTVGASEGLTLLIVVGMDADERPVMLLPLAISSENGIRVARFLGGKHPTFNMALWRRSFAESATKADLDVVMAAIRRHADVLALTQQPRYWMGISNPMAVLPYQASVNACPVLALNTSDGAQISRSVRRKMKSKERKLQALPGYHYFKASTDAEIKRLLDAFFIIKPLRMTAQGQPNVFADPAVEQFIRSVCLAKTPTGQRVIEVHGLECEAEVIAIFAGVGDGHRFSTMFNTYTISQNARQSPGMLLLCDLIDHIARENYTTFDLGVGSDDYKRQFCKGDEAIFDQFIALNARGKMAALAMSSLFHAKRLVKQHPALAQVAQRLRNAFHR